MKEHLVGYSYFGRSRGLQVINGGDIPKSYPVNDIVDLDPSVFEIERGQQLYRISRIDQGDKVLHFISIYEFAKEKSADRKGGFVGATVMLADCIAPAESIIICLVEMIGIVKQLLSFEEQRFTVSELKEIELVEPSTYSSLKARTLPGNRFNIGSGKVLFKIDLPDSSNSIFSFVQEALESEKLYNFEELFATQFEQILRKKNKIELVPYRSNYVSVVESIKREIIIKGKEFSNIDDKIKQKLLEKQGELDELKEKQNQIESDKLKAIAETNKLEDEIIFFLSKKKGIEDEIDKLEKKRDELQDLINKSAVKVKTKNRNKGNHKGRQKRTTHVDESERLRHENIELKEELENTKKRHSEDIADLNNQIEGLKYNLSESNISRDAGADEIKKKDRRIHKYRLDRNKVVGVSVLLIFILGIISLIFFLRSDKQHISKIPQDISKIRATIKEHYGVDNRYEKPFLKLVSSNKEILKSKFMALNDSVNSMVKNYMFTGHIITDFEKGIVMSIDTREEIEQKEEIVSALDSADLTGTLKENKKFIEALLKHCDCCQNEIIEECEISIPLLK